MKAYDRNRYVSPYRKKEFDEYRERLAFNLLQNGLDAEAIGNDPEAKNFISNYVDQNIIMVKPRDLLLGYTYKMAVMEIAANGKIVDVSTEKTPDKTIAFPIINRYKKHDLIESMYFKKDNNTISVITIPVLMHNHIIQ